MTVLAALEESPFATHIAESWWMFPIIEVLHVIGLALVVGSIAAFDLRILGVAWRSRSTATLMREVLPWTWGGFALALVTGLLMFASAATGYAANPVFLAKMGLLLLAGLNVLLFHLHPHQRRFAADGAPSRLLRASAGLSLTTWVTIVILGRWIAFV